MFRTTQSKRGWRSHALFSQLFPTQLWSVSFPGFRTNLTKAKSLRVRLLAVFRRTPTRTEERGQELTNRLDE